MTKSKANIDFLLVLHNNTAINLFNSNSPDWVKNLNNFNVNFLVRCPIELEKNIIAPTNSTLLNFDYHPLGPRDSHGSITHAFNLHRLLKEITSDFFIVSDPDIKYLGDWDQKDLIEVLDSYDLFGIPYAKSIQKIGRYGHMPTVLNTFFRSKSFFERVEHFQLMKDDKFWIFYPCGKKQGVESFKKNLDKSIPYCEEIIDFGHIWEKNRGAWMPIPPKFFLDQMSRIGYTALDTSWLHPIVFEDLKYLILPEIGLDLSGHSWHEHQYKSITIRHEQGGTKERSEYHGVHHLPQAQGL